MAASEELQKLIERYSDLLAENPDDVDKLINLAWSYERAGDYQQAVGYFRQAIERDPQNHDAYYGLGLALLGDGQVEEGLQALEKARDLAQNAEDRGETVIVSQQVEGHLYRFRATSQ